MNSQRLLGIVLLVAGVVLVTVARNASHSISDQFSNVFTGHFTERTTWYFAGGIVFAMLGVFMVLTNSRARRA